MSVPKLIDQHNCFHGSSALECLRAYGREGKLYRTCLGSESPCAWWERAQVRWGKLNGGSGTGTDALLASFRGRSGQTLARRGRMREKGSFSVLSLSYATFLIPLSCVGSNVPDGCRSAGVHAGQQGPAACSWDWAPTATGLLPVPGALPRRVHVRTQARAGTA